MERINGCAFLCNESGVIEQVLRDDFGFSEKGCEGKLFSSILDQQSRDKSLNMILETKNKNLAFDYRLDVYHQNRFKSLYFMGVHLGNQLLLIGADNHKEAVKFTHHLQEINNEQTNQIRTLLKEQNEKFTQQEKESEAIYDEFSRVNNELINLQRELNKKNAELKRLNELKNRFLGMAAHDLRNPLSNIRSLSGFLANKSDNLDERQKRFVENIKDLSSFMLNMVNELLDVSAIESGDIKINSTPTNLVLLITTNITLNKKLAEEKNIEVDFDSNVDSLILKVDNNKIDQVITNLLTNAIKYSKPDTKIIISLIKGDEEVKVSVQDQGQGIDKDEQKALFKPFQTTSTKSTAGEKSTGLGLYITKRIIDAHKGRIGVTSKKGEGSMFYFALPIEKNK